MAFGDITKALSPNARVEEDSNIVVQKGDIDILTSIQQSIVNTLFSLKHYHEHYYTSLTSQITAENVIKKQFDVNHIDNIAPNDVMDSSPDGGNLISYEIPKLTDKIEKLTEAYKESGGGSHSSTGSHPEQSQSSGVGEENTPSTPKPGLGGNKPTGSKFTPKMSPGAKMTIGGAIVGGGILAGSSAAHAATTSSPVSIPQSRTGVTSVSPVPVSNSPTAIRHGDGPSAEVRNDRVKKAMAWFQSEAGGGFTKEQAAGIVGNMVAESQMDTRVHGDQSTPGGPSIGLFQWREGRITAYETKFKPNHKLADASFEDQLAYATYELTKGGEQKAGRNIRQARNENDAAYIFTRDFERPKRRGNSYFGMDSRLSSASRVYNDNTIYVDRGARQANKTNAQAPTSNTPAPEKGWWDKTKDAVGGFLGAFNPIGTAHAAEAFHGPMKPNLTGTYSSLKDSVGKLIKLGGGITGNARNLEHYDPTFESQILAALKDYHDQTGNLALVTSGFRYPGDQEKIHGKYKKAAPGTSRHEYGKAIDLDEDQVRYMQRTGILAKHGLEMLANDPVHIQQIGGSSGNKGAAVQPEPEPDAVSASNPVSDAIGGMAAAAGQLFTTAEQTAHYSAIIKDILGGYTKHSDNVKEISPARSIDKKHNSNSVTVIKVGTDGPAQAPTPIFLGGQSNKPSKPSGGAINTSEDYKTYFNSH